MEKREYTKEEQDMLEGYIKELAAQQQLIVSGIATKRSLKRKSNKKVKLKVKRL